MRSHGQSQHYTGDGVAGFLSQKMDQCPKAKEDNELGLGEDSFKTCNSWPRQSHIAMKIIFHGGFVPIVSLS